MNNPEMRRTLVLSTGHLTLETRTWLAGQDWVNGRSGPCGGPYSSFGWFLYAHDDNTDFPSAPHAPEGEYPADLWSIFSLARTLRCDNVLLDCDAERIDELPFYEDETATSLSLETTARGETSERKDDL